MLQPATPGPKFTVRVHGSNMARLTQMPSETRVLLGEKNQINDLLQSLGQQNPDVTILAPASYLCSPREFNGCSKALGNPNV